MNALLNIFKIPELRKRVLFSIGMIAVYRIGIFVTIPGVNRTAMKQVVQQSSGTFLGMFNLFSGGALEQMSIFALGIMPYVSASIVLQLFGLVFKPLEELRKEGEAGQRKINQYTRYGTVLLAIFQGILIARGVEALNGQSQFGDVVREPGWGFRLMAMVAMTTGTAFLMWMGEQITERGIGNGISLVIFAGIVADLPDAIFQTISQVQIGQLQPVSLIVVAAIILLVVAIIVFFERGQRRLPIHYARRLAGRREVGDTTTHLPLKVNSAGVIPPIFAASLLQFPGTLALGGVPGMTKIRDLLQDQWIFNLLFVVLIVFFAFFYTSVTFQPNEVADNLQKQNAFIPKIRPGKETAQYIDYVLSRITFGGALYMAVVCTIPVFLQSAFRVPFFFGGTSIMIVVGVALDTVQQVESHLISHNYEGLAGSNGPRVRGRRG